MKLVRVIWNIEKKMKVYDVSMIFVMKLNFLVLNYICVYWNMLFEMFVLMVK